MRRQAGGAVLRGLAGLGLALMASACALPAAGPPVAAPLPYPPSAAARVLRLALDEWRDWGGVTRDAWPASPGGADAGPGPESAVANFPRVLAYWRAVEDDEGAIRDNRPIYAAALAGREAAAPLWGEPAWSAAFISWVFRSAGVDAREFPPNATHSLYLDALTEDAARFPATAPFLPRAPADYAPAPGDLVCLDRSRAPLRHWAERRAEAGVPRPMHCDIVTGAAASPAGGLVEVVGGNVGDTVTLTRYPADTAGRLLPAPPGAIPVLVIMQSRLGRLPPFANAGMAAAGR